MRILVVEDEHRIANSIKKGLEQERYAVDVAYTGSDGFDLVSTEDYDGIILDIMLPEMNGIESFWSYTKRRLLKFNGIRKDKFLLHLKESQFRWNNRKNIYKLLLENLREKPF